MLTSEGIAATLNRVLTNTDALSCPHGTFLIAESIPVGVNLTAQISTTDGISQDSDSPCDQLAYSQFKHNVSSAYH